MKKIEQPQEDPWPERRTVYIKPDKKKLKWLLSTCAKGPGPVFLQRRTDGNKMCIQASNGVVMHEASGYRDNWPVKDDEVKIIGYEGLDYEALNRVYSGSGLMLAEDGSMIYDTDMHWVFFTRPSKDPQDTKNIMGEKVYDIDLDFHRTVHISDFLESTGRADINVEFSFKSNAIVVSADDRYTDVYAQVPEELVGKTMNFSSRLLKTALVDMPIVNFSFAASIMLGKSGNSAFYLGERR
jgi:hypothetical protein